MDQKPEDKGAPALELFDFTTAKKKATKTKKAEASNAPKAQEVKQIHSYEFLLDRILTKLNENNPYASKTSTMNLKPIELDRTLPKKPKWSNFKEHCDILKRPQDHLAKFMSVNFGVEVQSAADKLIFIKAKIDEEGIKTAMKKYIQEYVRCKLCNSTSTHMIKDPEIRKYTIKCDTCSTSRTIEQ